MHAFIQYTPTEIIFGAGAEDRLADMVKKHGGSRVMLVYGGGSAVKSGLLDKMKHLLKETGVAVTTLRGVQPNPLLSLVREGIIQASSFGVDMVVGVGGGSAIDTAKAIAHGTANPDIDIWRIWKGEHTLTRSLPVGVVLTIAAAGSETSNSAVISNKETGEKRGLGTDFNRPKFALMNPELTYTLPPYQVACGIVDIMMHTLDRYFTKTEGNALTTEFAEAVLRVTIENGRTAMQNSTDYDAMSELMWCGSISHNGTTGLGTTPDFAVHQMGHELSAMFGVAHGASLSMMWGAWAAFTYKEKPARFARYAEKVWGVDRSAGDEAAALAGIDKTVAYFKALHMPTCFSESEIGIQSDETITELALRCTYFEKRMVGQFKKMDRHDLYQVYTLANR